MKWLKRECSFRIIIEAQQEQNYVYKPYIFIVKVVTLSL